MKQKSPSLVGDFLSLQRNIIYKGGNIHILWVGIGLIQCYNTLILNVLEMMYHHQPLFPTFSHISQIKAHIRDKYSINSPIKTIAHEKHLYCLSQQNL